MEPLDEVRARFAHEIQQQGGIRSAGLIGGLAAIRREQFLGPGPWKLMHADHMDEGYQLTPDDDPRHLYQNAVVSLDEQRQLIDSDPLELMLLLDTLDLLPGDRFLHVGCGVGYCTAIAAYAVGPAGAVVGVELDPVLAARAHENLGSHPTVTVTRGNGATQAYGTFDAILVNAGCTRVQPLWLEQLAPGGRLLLPLTVTEPSAPGIGAGGMLLVTRDADAYRARFTSPVGILHCTGARSGQEEALLSRAFAERNSAEVTRLRHDPHEPDADCWLHTASWCLHCDPTMQEPAPLALPEELLADYAGRYQIPSGVLVTVTLTDRGLLFQATGQPHPISMLPVSETQFLLREVDARITFTLEGGEGISGMLIARSGREVPAKRLAHAPME